MLWWWFDVAGRVLDADSLGVVANSGAALEANTIGLAMGLD